MAWVDGVLSPNYAVKSVIKLVLFFALPFGFSLLDRSFSCKSLFIFDKKRLIRSAAFGLFVYAFIVSVYYLVSPYFDFSGVTGTLQKDSGVNKNNFVFVAVYISAVNSLLEEFFFRGFAFLTLKKAGAAKTAYLFSAAAFSFYHIAFLTNWFNPGLFVFLIICLFLVGILFDRLDEKSGAIYPSLMVHIFANFAINTIGLILFGIV